MRDDRCAADGPRAIHHHRLSSRPRVLYCTYTRFDLSRDFFCCCCCCVIPRSLHFIFLFYSCHTDGMKKKTTKQKIAPHRYTSQRNRWPPQQQPATPADSQKELAAFYSSSSISFIPSFLLLFILIGSLSSSYITPGRVCVRYYQ